MNGINNTQLIKSNEEKEKLANQLKHSIDDFTASPKIKGYVKQDRENISPKRGEEKVTAKRHFINDQNYYDNIVFDSAKPIDSRNEIDKVLKYYNSVNKYDKELYYPPNMYELYHKEASSPLQRYNKAVRSVNLSPDHPNNKARQHGQYEVFKFGRSGGESQLKRSAEIIVQNSKQEESVKYYKFPHGYRLRK